MENYKEVVGGFDHRPFQSDNRTGDAAPFKDPTPNRNDNSMASLHATGPEKFQSEIKLKSRRPWLSHFYSICGQPRSHPKGAGPEFPIFLFFFSRALTRTV